MFINFVKQQVEIVREPEDGSLSHSLSSSSQQELQPMNSSSNSEENLDSVDEESIRIDQAGVSRMMCISMAGISSVLTLYVLNFSEET